MKKFSFSSELIFIDEVEKKKVLHHGVSASREMRGQESGQRKTSGRESHSERTRSCSRLSASEFSLSPVKDFSFLLLRGRAQHLAGKSVPPSRCPQRAPLRHPHRTCTHENGHPPRPRTCSRFRYNPPPSPRSGRRRDETSTSAAIDTRACCPGEASLFFPRARAGNRGSGSWSQST